MSVSNTSTNSPDDPLYTTQLYTSFIQQAYTAGYEFVTLEDLASRERGFAFP